MVRQMSTKMAWKTMRNADADAGERACNCTFETAIEMLLTHLSIYLAG